MNVLFISLVDFKSIQERHIYTDLLREFRKNGHKLYIISPIEGHKNRKTYIIQQEDALILKIRIGNTQKAGIVEKGISTVAIGPQFVCAIKKYLKKVKFDLVLYPTPPITFCKAVEYVKKRDGSKTYLLLKDIFPQNAVDIGMLNKAGVKGMLYQYFRKQEKRLYGISDRIGCMSPANVDYILKHNPELNREKVEICPNSIEPLDLSITIEERERIKRKYGLPLDRRLFVYGGNLGKPQGIPFMLKCLHSQRDNKDVFFLIIGNGTEYVRIERFVEKYRPENVRLYQWLAKDEYDKVVAACDVGMIFLDHRFTIPNFPSRLLSYMQAKLPVLAVTDRATDIGKVIKEKGFGWWCESDDVKSFHEVIKQIIRADLRNLGNRAYMSLSCYSVENQYKIIEKGTSPIGRFVK